jgi:5-methyltetrahydrofolate--homocysteine methyltransferase
MLIIGERINSSRKAIREAVSTCDRKAVQEEAKQQAAAGADYLDVNAGTFVGEEAERLKWLIEAVQEVSDLPLCVDSPDPGVIKAVLPLVKKKPMINSVTLEKARIEGILPLVKEYGAKVIGLCQSEGVVADRIDAKVEMASRLADEFNRWGIPLDDCYIDPLVYPLGTNHFSAWETVEAIARIARELPAVHTICGLTNVSYGLPNRGLVNRAFLTACVTRGLDSAILDPADKHLWAALKAALLVAGRDEFCADYLHAFRAGRLD